VRKRNLILGAIGIVVVVIAVYARVVMWPWIAMPDQGEVDRAWSSVEKAIADALPRKHDDPQLFELLAGKAGSAKREMDALAKQKNERTDETLPEHVHEALEALAAWAASVGTADEKNAPSCGRSGNTRIHLARLADVALAAHPDAARIAAFVKLSEHLRRIGGLLDYAIGMSILDHLLDASKKSGSPIETGADTRELRGVFARETYCMDTLFEGAGIASFEGSNVLEGADVPWFARRIVRPARERAMVRLTSGSRLERCDALIEDPERYGACLDDVPDNVSALPKSVGVRMTYALFPTKKYVATIIRYRDRSR
jgi:hypothetical protein